MLRAQLRGVDGDPESRESAGRRWRESDRTAYDKMRRRRAEIADDLGIDAGVLCPSRPLWGAIVSDPEDADALVCEAGLRPWQAELLRDDLWAILEEERARDGDAPA